MQQATTKIRYSRVSCQIMMVLLLSYAYICKTIVVSYECVCALFCFNHFTKKNQQQLYAGRTTNLMHGHSRNLAFFLLLGSSLMYWCVCVIPGHSFKCFCCLWLILDFSMLIVLVIRISQPTKKARRSVYTLTFLKLCF